MFFQIKVFLGPCFSGFRFFKVQVFKRPGLSGSGSRVRVQVSEVHLCIYIEMTLRRRCSPVNLLRISEHLFIRTTLKDCFVCLNFDFFAFVLLHSFYVSCELSHSSIKWSVEAATGRSSTKKLYCGFTQKLLEEVHVLVVLYVVSLQIY